MGGGAQNAHRFDGCAFLGAVLFLAGGFVAISDVIRHVGVN